MNVYEYLRKKLGVPDNWDKYDYETHRYSFDDIAEILHDVVNNKCNLPIVVKDKRSETPVVCKWAYRHSYMRKVEGRVSCKLCGTRL